MSDLEKRLDASVSKRPLLDHPFYRAWVDGTLGLGDLAVYSRQYWRQVQAFPSHLESLSNRAPAGVATALEANLRDELEGGHLRLWRDFAAAVGAFNLDQARVNDETRRCLAVFEAAAAKAPLAFGVGMIYGYESQTPRVAATKASGLRTHFSLDDGAIAYFDVHAELDVEHASQLLQCIGEIAASQEDVALAELGASLGANAIWSLLDGVWAELGQGPSGYSAN